MTYTFLPPPVVSVPVVGSSSRFPVHRIYCVGRNYAEHAKEMGHSGREPPVFFLKPADAALVVEAGTGELAYPGLTRELHHEVELVVALGEGGSDIAANEALRHVFGYAVGLDMTRRDLQAQMKKRNGPWDIGKAFDRAAPIGPITPSAQAGDILRGDIELHVNGERRQHSPLSQMIWGVPEIIAQLSTAWALRPGDLIYTGTPAGVGPVTPGDVMTGRVTGLESLRVRVV